MNSSNRKWHRLLGVALALPLILWMATGLLFHIKHRYAEAYETLQVPGITADWRSARLSPADMIERNLLDNTRKLELRAHPSGAVVYAGTKEGKARLIHAASGHEISPASEEQSKAWVEAAIAKSPNASRFGSAKFHEQEMQFSSWTGQNHPAFSFDCSEGKQVVIDRLTGEISQSGELNDWIDFTYRVHYLQWTPWKSVNIGLVLLTVPLVVLLAFSGLRMFFQKGK